MKRLLYIATLLYSVCLQAQQPCLPASNYGNTWNRGLFSVGLGVPSYNSQPNVATLSCNGITNGQLYVNIGNNTLNFYSNGNWYSTAGGGGGGITSITALSPLTGGTITTSGSIGIPVANAAQNGYLSSTDWSTFNAKQPAGSYITALTGDVTATGPGSVAATIGVNKVTYAKMQQASKVTLLGNPTSSTANIEEIVLGAGLSSPMTR